MAAVKLRDIIQVLDTWAPPRLAARWDNSGLQLGHPEHEINHVLISLDVDDAVLTYIQGHPVDLVITHHPLFFRPVKSLWFNSDLARSLQLLLNAHVHVFTMHTNLDAASNGVTDALIRAFGFNPDHALSFSDSACKYLTLPESIAFKFLHKKFPTAKSVGDSEKTLCTKIAFCGGSGGSFLEEAFQLGVDCFITGEVNYHHALYCQMNAMCCLTLGHKESERFILPVIKSHLEEAFPELGVAIC